MRGGVPTVAFLLALSCLAAAWAARPFQDLPDVVPQEGGVEGAQAGGAISVVGLLALGAVAALLVWAVRKDLDRALRWLTRAGVAFGLLLLLVPFVLRSEGGPGGPGFVAWLAAVAAAAGAAWLARAPGWRSWLAAALAAGGFAGLAAGVAGLAVLALVAAAVAAYDAWAVRRESMAEAAAAADRAALPLSVGEAQAGLSLGLGDLLLPAALVAAAVPFGWGVAAGAAAGLAAGFAALAAAVRHGDAPGIPYLAGGALAGTAVALGARMLAG